MAQPSDILLVYGIGGLEETETFASRGIMEGWGLIPRGWPSLPHNQQTKLRNNSPALLMASRNHCLDDEETSSEDEGGESPVPEI